MRDTTTHQRTVEQTVEPLTSQHPSDDTLISAFPARIGRRRFIQGVGAAAGLGALSSVVPALPAAALAAGASQFIPLPVAVRALDTRRAADFTFTAFAENYVRVPINGRFGVPAEASAVVATLTAVNRGGGNWVTIVPSGASIGDLLAQNKLVSALNMSAFNEATANLVQVKLSGGGVDLYALNPCDLVLDVIGYYRPVSGSVREGRFEGLTPAARAIDTRLTTGAVGSGQTLVVDVTAHVPDHASSAVINLTATECAGPGYFTVYPYTSSTVPDVSSLNVNAYGATRASAVIVPVSTQANGRRYIKVFALTAAQLIVDVTGFFTSSRSALGQNGLFVPVDPVRILDTRDAGPAGRLWPGWTVEGMIPGAGATGGAAAVVNLTGVNSRNPGYLTLAAARTVLPGTSNLNFSGSGQVVPNHAITPITAGYGYQAFASHGCDVLVDYTGYYTGTPGTAQIGPPVNPDPPPIGPDWILRVPAIGLESRVKGGSNSIGITNSGYSWHWTNSGFLGEEAHVAAFAHRTTHGGAYRNIHLLSGGDQLTLTTMDGREYTYEVIRRDLTNSATANILNATRLVPGRTFSMIACSKTNFEPTNVNYRIIVTAALVGWRAI